MFCFVVKIPSFYVTGQMVSFAQSKSINLFLFAFFVCKADNMQLSSVPWRCVVIDEAHRLKNRNCKLLEGLNNLSMVYMYT